jgi:hypothetical protein
MGVIPALVWAGLHLSCVVIDMALLLLFFRIVGQWRRIGWVATINHTAEDIVDRLTAAIGLRWQALLGIRLSQRGALAASVLALCLARLLLQGLAGLLT